MFGGTFDRISEIVLFVWILVQIRLTSMTTSMLLSLQTRYLIISFLYVNQNCIDCLIKKIGIGNSIDNPTYIPMILTKVKIQDNHLSNPSGKSIYIFSVTSLTEPIGILKLFSNSWIYTHDISVLWLTHLIEICC
jgi:hypothetical protein